MNKEIDLDFQELKIQNERILRTLEKMVEVKIRSETKNSVEQEFYTIEDCARLKSGASLSTYKNNRFWLPGCGNKEYEYHIAGRIAFKKEEVEIWKNTPDEAYLEYARSRGVTTIPDRYLRILKEVKKC